jgi:hypothetical protein
MNKSNWWGWIRGLRGGATIGEDEQEDQEEQQMKKRIWIGTIVAKGSN